MPKIDRVTRVKIAQEQNKNMLSGLPNVIGTATGFRQKNGQYTDEICVQVFVSRKYPLSHLPDEAIIPREVFGLQGERVRTDVIDAGFFQPLQDTTRYRPAPGGCSIGNLTRMNAGTLGGWACDETDDSIVFLTNNHVVTASTNRSAIPAVSGIVQQGQLDGGTAPADLIGQTKRIVPIATSPAMATAPITAVDAAIGTITVDRLDNVLQIGPGIYEIATPTLGMNVQKRGRTTRLTTNGRITSVNASITINYGPTGAPAFGTIGIGTSVFNITSTDGNPFGIRGDSGSLIFSQTAGVLSGTFPVVGLLFSAGSNGPVAAFGTLVGACDINAVFTQLNLTTICDCAVRAFLEAIFGPSERGEATEFSIKALRRKEAQLRRFRDYMLRSGPIGEMVVNFVTAKIPELARVVFNDEETFGLALRTFDPWLWKRSNLDILEAELDEETVKNFTGLVQRIAKISPDLKATAQLLGAAVAAAQGKRVADLLKSSVPKQGGRRKR